MDKVRKKQHGMSGTRLNRIWRQMRQRCNNPKDRAYRWYGAKGVKVYWEWEKDFVSFMEWATTNGYQEHLTIDRLDSTKGYTPDNCRWITREENTRRARLGSKNDSTSTRKIEYQGESRTIEEWADHTGMKYITLYARLKNPKWSVEEALGYKPRENTNVEKLTYKGVSRTISEWAVEIGVPEITLRKRLKSYDMPIEKALTYINPHRKPNSRREPVEYTYEGKTLSTGQWAKLYNIPYITLYKRLNDYNMPIEEALTKKVKQA